MFDPLELLLPLPVYLVLVLTALAAYGLLPARKRVPMAVRGLLVVMAAWSWLMTTPALANLAVRVLEGSPDESGQAVMQSGNAPLIIVLASGGMKSRDGRPRPRLDASGWERLRAGIRLWHQTGGTLLFTGGPDGNPEHSLAGLMRAIAMESGVPSSAILMASHSLTTYEDIAATRTAAADFSGRVWLVTSALHMPRALGVAARLGMDVEPRRCDFIQIEAPTWRAWLPDNGGPALWSAVLHELAGRAYYRLRGWSD